MIRTASGVHMLGKWTFVNMCASVTARYWALVLKYHCSNVLILKVHSITIKSRNFLTIKYHGIISLELKASSK